MDSDSDDPETCVLCGRKIPDELGTRAADESFCSTGCRTVHQTLGADDTTAVDGTRRTVETPDTSEQARATDSNQERRIQSFLRVDGMHTTTCESFLEGRATACEGVVDAEASYVTETVRVVHDSDQISQASLCEQLSTIGYTAVPRSDAPIDSNAAAARGDRQLDDLLGYRYAAGVLFGSFLLLTYVVLVYPAHLSELLGEGSLSMFEDAFRFDEGGAVLVVPLFLGLTGVVLFFTGLPLLRDAYVSIRTRQPTTELLTVITVVSAFLYSPIAMVLGRTDVYFDLTVVIASVVVAVIFYESLVKQRAMARLTDLTISQVENAQRYHADGTTTTVPVEELMAGDRILVSEGERIPVDGTLVSPECTVNEAVVTGESLPIVKSNGDEVVGGSVVTGDGAVVRVADGATSGIDRLLTSVWGLQSADHGIQRRANRIAGSVIPVLVAGAVLVGAVELVGGDPTGAVLGALTVLLVATPWALGLATPLSVATMIEAALRRGIVVFDETIFERLRAVDIVVFDKTGTLTTGEMTVVESSGPDELLTAAARLEQRAAHPAADAIATEFAPEAAADESDGDERVRDFETHPRGVRGTVDGTTVFVGHPDLFDRQGWAVSDDLLAQVADARSVGRLPVLVGRDGRAEALVIVGDRPRARWDEAISRLSEHERDIVVLTGDDERAAEFFGQHPHVDHVFADVPASGKTETVRRLQAAGSVAMVGDGTNDAPALAQADLGIALGSGTAIASDAADIAIEHDDLGAVDTTFRLARSARRRVRQNTALALSYNGIAVPLALFGLFNPLCGMAAVVVTGSLLAANATRSLRSV